MPRRRSLLGVLLLLFAVSVQAQVRTPDRILVHGRVFTGNDSHPYAEALAIQGGTIMAVGSSSEIETLASATTQRIDLGGRVVIPGINDGHVHFEADVIGRKLDFGSDPLCAAVLDGLRRAVATVPAGTVVSGVISQKAFFDAACTPGALDSISHEDPIVLSMDTPHSGMLNRAAALRFGVLLDAPPPLASFYGKDMKSRRWDGVVHESEWFRIRELLMGDRAGEPAKLRKFLEGEARWGVTSITFLDVYPARRLEQLDAIDSPLRVRLVPFLEFQDRTRRRQPEFPAVPAKITDRVTVSGEKYLLDGTPVERSAAMRVPYADAPGTSGQVDFPPEQVREILRDALQKHVQLLLHSIGDRTTDTLLTQMEATGGSEAWQGRRLRIEHGDGVLPDLIPRVKRLGAIVVENPANFTLGELMQARFGPEKAAVVQPFRSLLAAGVPLAIATDASVGDPVANPYLHLMYASAYPGKPQDSLTREEALIAFTRTAAYAEFAETKKGTLEPGKLADLAVLTQDIFHLPSEDLPKTESVLTIVGGTIAYAGGDFRRYLPTARASTAARQRSGNASAESILAH